MENNEWYDKGYKAGCEYLAHQSDNDLLYWLDQYGWDVDSPECEAFSKGFGSAYGCDDLIDGQLVAK